MLMKSGVLPESHETVYNLINRTPVAELSADRELLVSRFDNLIERVMSVPKSLREVERNTPPNFQTLPLVVGKRDEQKLSLQIYVYKPRPVDAGSGYAPNYDPSIITKWFLEEGAVQEQQVIENMDYLSKKHLREKISSEDKGKQKEFEEQLVGRLDAIEQAVVLYEQTAAQRET